MRFEIAPSTRPHDICFSLQGMDSFEHPDGLYSAYINCHTKRDTIVHSAHAKPQQRFRSVAVISYVPANPGPEWLDFYASLYHATEWAADRATLTAAGTAVGFTRPGIPLDGVSFGPPDLWHNTNSLDIPVYNADNNGLFWEVFERFVAAKYPMFKPVTLPQNNAIGIAFQPSGAARLLQLQRQLKFLSVASDPDSNPWFDCRQVHTVYPAIAPLINLPGHGAAEQQIHREFKAYVDELMLLVEHASGKKLRTYSSNVGLLDRIFHHLNIAGHHG